MNPDEPGDVGYDGPSPSAAAAGRLNQQAQFKENGYASTVIDETTGSIQLWWRGKVDANVQQIIDEINRGDEARVEVHQAARSRGEMRRLGLRFHKNERLAAQGVTVHGVTAPPDQSGFDVLIEPAAPGSSASQRSERRDRARQEAASVVGVPVRSVTEAKPSRPLSRQDDAPAWWGGAFMLNSSSSSQACSTGFAVTDPATGIDSLLSAAHCNTPYSSAFDWYDGTRATSGSGGELISGASSNYYLPQYDTRLLDVVDSDGGMYIGPYNSNDARAVRDVLPTSVNETTIRTSGANSGEHGNHTVQSITYDRQCFFDANFWCFDGVIAADPQGDQAAALMDSGGPVFSYSAGTDPRVWARGIIVEHGPGENPLPACVPAAINTPQCYKRYVFQPLSPILAAWAVDLRRY